MERHIVEMAQTGMGQQRARGGFLCRASFRTHARQEPRRRRAGRRRTRSDTTVRLSRSGFGRQPMGRENHPGKPATNRGESGVLFFAMDAEKRGRFSSASASSRRPTGTPASSPARTARPGSSSAHRWPCPPTASPPAASPAATPSSARPRPSSPSEGLLRRPEGPRRADPGRPPASSAAPSRRGQGGRLRLAVYAGGRDEVFPRPSTSSTTASTR